MTAGRLAALAALVIAAAAPAAARAQVRRPPQAPTRPVTGVRADTLPRRDSLAGRDTVGAASFAPPDSVMLRLLNLPGYTVTQYQGEQIAFDAITRAIQLTTKAIVQRDSQLVKSDTISYSGTGSQVRVGTDSAGRSVFVAPGQAPIVSRGPGTYDIASRRASVRDIRTAIAQSGETLQITGEQVVVVASRDSVKGRTTRPTTCATGRSRRARTPSPTTTSRRGRSSAPARSSWRGRRCSTSATCR